MRRLVGATLFAVVLVWVVRDGTYLAKLNAAAFFASLGVALLTALAQAATLSAIARANGRWLPYPQALRVTALGTAGNAAGGIPIGTAVKFGLLHQQAKLSLAQITAGMVSATVLVSVGLLGFASVSAWALEVPGWVRAAPTLVLVAVVAGAVLALLVLRSSARLWPLLAPYVRMPCAGELTVLSLFTAAAFVTNCCLVGILLGNDNSTAELVFLSSAGTVIGLLSMLQSVAGVHELSMGLASYVAGAQPVEGVQIALTLRATAIGSSALILLSHGLLHRGTRSGEAK